MSTHSEAPAETSVRHVQVHGMSVKADGMPDTEWPKWHSWGQNKSEGSDSGKRRRDVAWWGQTDKKRPGPYVGVSHAKKLRARGLPLSEAGSLTLLSEDLVFLYKAHRSRHVETGMPRVDTGRLCWWWLLTSSWEPLWALCQRYHRT